MLQERKLLQSVYERMVERIRRDMSKQGLKGAAAAVRGRRREQKTLKALHELQRRGVILHFSQTESLGWEDVMEGTDFLMLVRRRDYSVLTIPLSVTGRYWVAEHRRQHPSVPVIGVGNDTVPRLMRKVKLALRSRLRQVS